ncbi:DsbA family oxidoreductase [Aquipuribacter sp. MA13-6]|uniref:DsbA family oxidoreductase n=1 Tax=unclassified Aquipuribacter TaxID=2635084 RepID=UPI003EED74D6
MSLQTPTAPLTVEVWSDVVCPWCYIGKRRLEAAIAQLGADEVRVVWRSFQLDPTSPRPGEPGHGTDVATYLGEKYGGGREAGLQMNARVSEVAAGDGLDFHLEAAVRGSTTDAHRLIHLASSLDPDGANGLQDRVKERFLRAYFTDGHDVSRPEVLRDLAVDAGLPAQQVDDVLSSVAFARDVAADQAQAQAYGATGVPFTVVGGKYGVSGAQPVEVFAEALRRARAERTPALVQVGGVASADGSGPGTAGTPVEDAEACGPDGCAVPQQ